MSVIVFVSLLLLASATIGSLVLLTRSRSRTAFLLVSILLMMALHQGLAVGATWSVESTPGLVFTNGWNELPVLALDALMLVAVLCFAQNVRSNSSGKTETEQRYRRLVEHSPFCIHESWTENCPQSMTPV